MPALWEMRAELVEEEKQRRKDVCKAIMELADYTQAQLDTIFDRVQKRMLVHFASEGELPTISARYFFWALEWHTWCIILDAKDDPDCPAFPFPAPEKFGAPYSEIYLSHLTKAETNVGADNKLEELERRAKGPAKTNVEVPAGCPRHLEFLKELWEKMWPGRPYEEGCDEPFVIRFSDDDFVFFHLCIARDIDELGDVMQRAAFLLGGQEVNLIALIGDDKRVCFALDFGKHAEKECPAVQIRFQRAWVDLLGVYLEWLRGRNVNIVAYLESEYGARLGRQPTGTFDEIKEEQSVRTARLRDWMRQAVVLQPNDPQRAMKLLKFQMGRVRVAAQKAAVNVCPRPVASLTLGMCFADVSNFVTDPRFRCLTKPELMGMVSSVAARMAEVGAHYEMSMAKTAKEVYEDLGQFVLGNRWDDILPPMQRLDVCEGVLMRDTRTRSTVQNWVQKIRTELEGRRRGIEEDLP